ncbi:MAG: protein adenylyltransferase SelO [Candidatus Cyclobacteriaceae bacterium M2_1C_046]
MNSTGYMENISSKKFKNEFVETFNGDDIGDLSPRQTPGVLYSRASPTPVEQPKLLGWSEELANTLGINKPNEDDVKILSGNLTTPSMKPYASCYGGHQFGHWAGQLGDGRAITLGEWERSDGRSWEIQLKGAGLTAYSRMADGRAVLRSSLREYLMSEAMHHLGIPTTRALSLVSTGEQIVRDMFYTGNPEFEPGAIVTRTAPSFLRFGNYQILAAREEHDNLEKLVNWTIDKFFPHIEGEDKIMRWYREVIERTASLMVEWMRVGFVHGVMNTDNMSILGLTIDYGPYSFLDHYDKNFTPNTTDLPGRRYAFGRQPNIAQWNLAMLAGAILPLVGNNQQILRTEIEAYEEIFNKKYFLMMGNKLGLDMVNAEDLDLIDKFDNILSVIKPDMTIFYQLLIDLPIDIKGEEDLMTHFEESFYEAPGKNESTELYNIMKLYTKRIKANTISREDSKSIMKKTNPRFILRNYLLHQAIEKLENGDDSLFTKLEQAMKEPYSHKFDEFFVKRPDWATTKAGCSMLSCSS